jgi:hypothetical protein
MANIITKLKQLSIKQKIGITLLALAFILPGIIGSLLVNDWQVALIYYSIVIFCTLLGTLIAWLLSLRN